MVTRQLTGYALVLRGLLMMLIAVLRPGPQREGSKVSLSSKSFESFGTPSRTSLTQDWGVVCAV